MEIASQKHAISIFKSLEIKTFRNMHRSMDGHPIFNTILCYLRYLQYQNDILFPVCI